MQHEKRRLFDHVVLRVKNLDQSKNFYRAIAETLGHTITKEGSDCFFIDELEVREHEEVTREIHLAFKAENPGSVKLFHEAAIRLGGKCLGSPGSPGPGTYVANVEDPDGNVVGAIFKDTQKSISISY